MHHKLAVLCIASAIFGASTAFASEPAHNPSPPSVVDTRAPSAQSPSAPQAATHADKARYAAKEAASPNAKDYKGGDDVVVIGASTTAVVLAVVLLVVLL